MPIFAFPGIRSLVFDSLVFDSVAFVDARLLLPAIAPNQ